MPIAYYGSRISPHKMETHEGYLICMDVPINRIGAQDYLGSEIGLQGADADRTFKVLRPPKEVFDKATLASFEGKPTTDNHPPENVNAGNIQFYGRGHAQNVRIGNGENEGCTIADLYITDPQLIQAIRDGKREISCGYTYDLVPNKNGTFEQRRIRGNHIAVVDEGRAGHRVAIKDSKPIERGKNMAAENKGSVFGRMLKAFAKDESTTPEDLEEAAKVKKPGEEATDETPKAEEKPAEIPPKETAEKGKDEAPENEMLGKVLAMLNELKTMLQPKESADELEDMIKPEHEAPEDESEGNEGDESPEEQEPSVTVSPEDLPEKHENGAMDSARQAAIITRQILQKNITDPKAFKMAAKDAAAEIRKAYGIHQSNDGYTDFIKATSAAAKERAAKDSATVNSYQKAVQEAQSYYDALDPHKNKEAK